MCDLLTVQLREPNPRGVMEHGGVSVSVRGGARRSPHVQGRLASRCDRTSRWGLAPMNPGLMRGAIEDFDQRSW